MGCGTDQISSAFQYFPPAVVGADREGFIFLTIGLGYVEILSDINSVGSDGNIFKPDPTVDRASCFRNSTE